MDTPAHPWDVFLLADNSNGDNYTSAKDCGKFLKTIYQIDKGTATDNKRYSWQEPNICIVF